MNLRVSETLTNAKLWEQFRAFRNYILNFDRMRNATPRTRTPAVPICKTTVNFKLLSNLEFALINFFSSKIQ